MELNFTKYEGAGNDFILVDGRNNDNISLATEQIALLCHRRFGIGADGLMVLTEGEPDTDFSMVFYNSDGKEGSMCGNGGRCIAMFAEHLGLGSMEKFFSAPDGVHSAYVNPCKNIVELGMNSVEKVFKVDDGWFTDTGSPHLVITDEPFDLARARRLRQLYDANVNFIEILEDKIVIRTFERGVEDETWACGTGAVASALVRSTIENTEGQLHYDISARGGELSVEFNSADGSFEDIVLTGEARRIFSGKYYL